MTNYESGANFERLMRRWLEAGGYVVVRSAGSKSPIDLVAWRENSFAIIQCKVQKRKISYDDEVAVLRGVALPRMLGDVERLLFVKNGKSVFMKNVDTGGFSTMTLREVLKECLR
jgi:Holliday junction resolvase